MNCGKNTTFLKKFILPLEILKIIPILIVWG